MISLGVLLLFPYACRVDDQSDVLSDSPGGEDSAGGVEDPPSEPGTGGLADDGGVGGAGGCTSEKLPLEDCPTCAEEKLTAELCHDFRGIIGWVLEGCGYLRSSWEGDVGDTGESFYSLKTGALVYTFIDQQEWDGEYDCSFVSYGEEPLCDDWGPSTYCSAAGGAGGSD
jgi:hypothetical protein